MTAPVQSFYSQISANRRRSLLLVLLLTAFLGFFGFVIGFAMSGGYWQGGLFATGIAVVIALLMTSVSYFAGDGIVLAASGARELNDQVAPQLMNVVREMSIAANIPVPKVYSINDTAPNAFATGRDPKHASLAVTTGLLEKLDREELQGVIGHELAHVRNLDIRFALLVATLVGSIALLADFFLRFTMWGGMGGGRGGRDRGGGGGGLVIIAIVVGLILSIIAPIIARLVQLAVSRQREYLADSSSVELTRNPYGLERALVKISSDREVLEVANRATQHLYFVNPIKKFEARAAGLTATHPPIVDRVNRLRSLTGQAPVDQQGLLALAGLD
ncbi:MAG: heat shock protein HtpX [Chloroflexota bacterium]|jgi:heat shock protein HtpX|nr:heat shock protein HtpX [Chloroflexota bacterium]